MSLSGSKLSSMLPQLKWIGIVVLLFIVTNGEPASNSSSAGMDNIMFFDYDALIMVAKSEPKCSESGKIFCTGVENYPALHFENLINADSKKFEQLFGEDLLVQDFPTRFDPPGEESLCGSSERLVFPKAGFNKEDKWRFIVNHEKYKQGIRVEECINAGDKCSMTESFPNGYKTQCKQNYVYRQLLSLSADGTVLKDQFKVPSSCKCVLKQI